MSEKDLGRLIQRTLLGGVALSMLFFCSGFVSRGFGLDPGGRSFKAGIAVLLLTPAARVAMLVYGYWRTREYRFALAALTVLTLLFASALL